MHLCMGWSVTLFFWSKERCRQKTLGGDCCKGYFILSLCFLNYSSLGQTLSTVSSVQRKFVSDSLGLVDFAIRLVICVLNLTDRQVLFFGKIQITVRIVINPANQKGF